MIPKGHILKGSTMHTVAQTILAYPKLIFSAKGVWEDLCNDYPNIKLVTVSACMSKANSPLNCMIQMSRKRGSRVIYAKKSKAKMPPVFDPQNLPIKRKKRTKHKHTSGSSTVQKPQPIPETVTDSQIGNSIILYIEQLKMKIQDMGLQKEKQEPL